MPVVIKRGSGGVLFHEACGHGLEADAIAKGASVYAGKVGEQVASSNVTLIDDGTMAGEWGTLGFDDEGHATQRNVLIENGVLTDYMWDFIRARKEDKPFRGNGRRESYRHLPMVRMTNTYVLGGPDDEEEIVRFTDYGVYVAELGGGQVNPATGDFVFGMLEAYLIENGEITVPLREGNLIGNGLRAARHRHDRRRLRHGPPGHVRQGRPGRAGRRRPPDAASQGADGRRDGCGARKVPPPMRATRRQPRSGQRRPAWPGNAMKGELEAIAAGIIDGAHPGEQIEAYLSRGGETQVRVYQGNVEKYVAADSAGVGVRVIRDGRTGFAYAGTLDESALEEVVAEARDNVPFETVDDWAGLAEPDGVAVTEQSLWSDELAGYPNEGKIELALDLEKLALAADPRIRMDDANYADGGPDTPSPRPRGSWAVAQRLLRDGLDARRRGHRDPDRVRLQCRTASRRARTPVAAGDAVTRATWLLGATKPPSKRVTVVLAPSSRRSSCRSSARR